MITQSDLEDIRQEFALRLCELAKEHPQAARAFTLLSDKQKIEQPSDRVWACFVMTCQDKGHNPANICIATDGLIANKSA
jgi:hypothetical protein